MKTRLILLLGLAFLLNACAAIKPATATEADSASAYVHAVENSAFGRATRVIWVNPPDNKDFDRKKD